MQLGLMVNGSGSKGRRTVMITLSFSCFSSRPSFAGVNSFMVYMAYKDLYQVSNTEVTTHLLCGLGYLDGFPIVADDLGPCNMNHCGHCGRPLGQNAS